MSDTRFDGDAKKSNTEKSEAERFETAQAAKTQLMATHQDNYEDALAAYPAQVIIDMQALRDNMAHIVDIVNSGDSSGNDRKTEVMGVVKADAYGHGLVPCALAALAGGATWLGTAQAYEALALRKAGIRADRARILTWLGNPLRENYTELIENDIDISVGSVSTLEAVIASAQTLGKPARIHVEVDTGFGRGGFVPRGFKRALDIMQNATVENNIEVIGLWSHLSSADDPLNPLAIQATNEQVYSFGDFSIRMKEAGVPPLIRHLANTAAIFTRPTIYYDMVRPGIGFYGYEPDITMGTSKDFGLRPAMTLQAQVAVVKDLSAGHTVSYGRAYKIPGRSDHSMAIIPLGYADGIHRAASGLNSEGSLHTEKLGAPIAFRTDGEVKIFHISGRVCMDQLIVDLGLSEENLGIHDGDTAILFGPGQGAEFGEPTVDDWAQASRAINYEICTTLRGRIPRLYRNAENVLSANDLKLLDPSTLI